MYVCSNSRPARWLRGLLSIVVVFAGAVAPANAQDSGVPPTLENPNAALIRKISGPSERLELTTNTSRILTLEKPIPRVQVNNPDLLSVTPLSANEIQISAKKAGVTAVNLWDSDGQLHTVDVFIYGDVRELEHALKTQFPNSSIKVYRYSSSLVLTGFIDRPDYVTPIVQMAEDYSPKVINNISVGGVQQVLLKVKVFEVNRTKSRELGFDWALVSGGGGFVSARSANILTSIGGSSAISGTGQTVNFGIVSGGSNFFGMLEALQSNGVAKILAEPNLVAISGRPAQFNEGGEVPVIIPQGLGQQSIEYKPFGTQVDFLPIVLGNGRIRLEVRPRISARDEALGTPLGDTVIPGFVVRQVDTAVEMQAGQTFALAGLIQRQVFSQNRGLPYLSDMPILGAPFRKVEERVQEIELLILVTPEFIDAMDPHEVPQCLPGMATMSPDNGELYWGGHVEVPNRCNQCGQCGCVPTHGHEPCCPGGSLGSAYGCNNCQSCGGGAGGQVTHFAPTPAGMDPSYPSEMQGEMIVPQPLPATPTGPEMGGHGELVLPPAGDPYGPMGGAQSAPSTGHYAAPREPQYQRQAARPYTASAAPAGATTGGLIGPVGYDAE
ncbi:Type II secretion system protein D precursor [Pirellulimonas nuda]|uniref:Type II secretion system protein D n=1 Tax=Pirellulimonas nuda TaxID=2528009 RepID=A0A518DF55_9BACT|nr:pilus assembly protein N-terminal domain-containing protein [Pirellulimonas nuda]QDU90107.1 Type II secretion system protein D precursor [Pirellulimonas nuda]